jgi:3-oxoisoapionate kinase
MSRLLSYYGDDFTGSTDVMEALAMHGVETVLFTRIPTAEEFTPFVNHAAMGLAGTSRSQTPAWMDSQLPAIFTWLKSLKARYCHYKVCSTFDSSPTIGNIGRACEIGARVFGQAMVPLVVGAPQLKRYTFAGHLFAGYQGEVYRIDRHPVMARHPVTPMAESDLRLHLAAQTSMPVDLANETWPELGLGLADVHDVITQLQAGEKLLNWSGGLVAGSSGVEYALAKALVASGKLTGFAAFSQLAKLSQTVVMSGSVSPTTERQIRAALAQGFVSVPVMAHDLAGTDRDAIIADAVTRALRVLEQGASPIVHTALGPSSEETSQLAAITDGRNRVGEGLGRILRGVIDASGLRRVIVAGGDTSSHALGQLDIYALTTRMPLPATPGSPLCLTASCRKQLNGIEIALKGGQVGGDDYFVRLRDGVV